MNTAKGLDAIVVMAEAARGFDANWWNAEPDASIAQLGALLGGSSETTSETGVDCEA